MDYQAIVQIISNNGFPIIMCLLLYRQMLTSEETHKQEIEGLKESITANTNAMNALIQTIERKK